MTHLSLQAQNGTLTGAVYLDVDTNCVQTLGDELLYDIIIEARDTTTNTTFYAATSFFQNGSYSFNLPAGTYEVNANVPYDHPYASFCQNNVIRTVFPFQTDTIFFYLPPTTYNPLMQVDISSDGLPDCGLATYYLKYQNYGTAPATNVSIEVEFDTSISLLNANSVFTFLGNNRYLFPLGTAITGRDSLSTIRLDVDIDCGLAVPGQTHFAKATISPEPIINYSGPILKTEGECLGNEVQFRTSNIGDVNALSTTSLIVIEDDVMYLEPAGPLDTLFEDTLSIAAVPTRMYRVEAAQFAGVPKLLADPIQWAAVEGCVDSLGSFNTTNFLQYYTEDARPHISYDYQNGGDTANYNQIRAQLKGYGPNRLIGQNVPIEYQIRFKNYGPTTLFGVVIRDSIPEELDLNTLVINSITDNFYDLRIENGRELVLEMPWLTLGPNESGFISFSLDQMPNNPLGTVIEHRAEITMGNGSPLITPMIFHTIGENFIRVLSQEALVEQSWELSVYPNPMQHYANFELQGGDFEELVLEIYNMQGQLIKRLNRQGNIIQLERDELTAGHYAYRVLADGQAVNTGKLLVR
jgi:uncharacterized repeat protein (TIGR01451 family)